MTQWLPFALVSMTLVGVGDLLFRRAAVSGIRPASFIALQTLFFAPTALGIAVLTGSLRWGRGALWGVVIGLMAPFAAYAFLRSLESAKAQSTINTPIYRLGIVVTALLAVVLLREPVSLSRGGGLVLAVAAIVLLSGASIGRLSIQRSGIPWALLGMAIVGTINFLYKLGALFGASPPVLVLLQTITMSVVAFLNAYWTDGGFRPTPAVWAYAPITGVINSSARMLLIWGLSVGDATPVVTVYSLGFVVTFVLAVVLFGERLSARKVVGLVLAVLAIVYLNS